MISAQNGGGAVGVLPLESFVFSSPRSLSMEDFKVQKKTNVFCIIKIAFLIFIYRVSLWLYLRRGRKWFYVEKKKQLFSICRFLSESSIYYLFCIIFLNFQLLCKSVSLLLILHFLTSPKWSIMLVSFKFYVLSVTNAWHLMKFLEFLEYS